MFRRHVNLLTQKYSSLPKFGNGVCVAPSRLILEGRSCGRLGREPGLRWTRQRRHEMVRAGRVVPVSSKPRVDERRCQASSRQHVDGNVHNAVGRCGANGPCVRQNRVVLAVVAAVKPLAEMCASPTGRTASSIRGARETIRKGRLPGEHGISRPTIAQGRPSDRHHLYAAVRSFCATSSRSGPWVRGRHPAFPAPSWISGQSHQSKLGRNAPRGCEGVSAIDVRCHRPTRSGDPVFQRRS